MTRILIKLREDENRALAAIAREQRRDPRDQAAVLIRQQLAALGVLQPQAVQAHQVQAHQVQAK